MAIRPVLRMGDPRLLQVAAPVAAFDTAELHQLLQDMHDTMASQNGAGLAAPQIGVAQRVVIFGNGRVNPRYPSAEVVPPTVLINPLLQAPDAQCEGAWEGCLSVPGMRGWVERFLNLHYQGFDQYGEPISRRVSGFHARVVQHEVDHLDGILYPMRIEDMSRFGFIEELFPGEAVVDD